MKKMFVLLACGFLLTACSQTPLQGSDSNSFSEKVHVDIEWVDFVKFDGTEYHSIDSGVIADPLYVGKEIGEVAFNVSGNITNPHYRTKNGDAAFWDEGTKIFTVKDAPEFIAIKDIYEINGYRMYQSRNGYAWHFKDVDQSAVNKIDIFEGYHKPTFVRTISTDNEINDFLEILTNGENHPLFSPDYTKGDPLIYHMVLHTGQLIAYKYVLFFDGTDWYWHPWETAILSNEIENYTRE